MIKLVEALGTKYLTTNWCSDIMKYIKAEDVIDVAGAHICRDAMGPLLRAAYNAECEIIDSEDPERAAFFAENARRGELHRATEHVLGVQLPLPECVEDVVESIKKLDANTVYYIVGSQNKVEVSYAILVQAARPEIEIRLGAATSCMFKLIHWALFPNKHRWDEFYLLKEPTFVVANVGDKDYTEFVGNNIVVPTEFGRECLMHRPEWEACLSRILGTLRENFRPAGRHIKDYL